MAVTENLKLELISPSDFVSPEPINNAIKALDSLGLDYIVEQGKSGEWWYRKWKSGHAECGINDKNFGRVDHKTQWGAMYGTNSQQTFGAYPFAFSEKPFVTITFNGDGSGTSSHQSYIAAAHSQSTTVAPSFRTIDPYSGTYAELHCGIYVVGTYK